ncbi:MAG TPA: LytTR family DNA-binding domain-containing protein, partial [Hanamia sp.]|nr:LytTR family DNA-binding domain-containing protein [Hanamia sp.]
EAVPVLHLEGAFSNAVDALTLLQKKLVDLLFLDIQMPHILGTNFIRALPKPPKVIFTTAYRKFAVEGFDLDAVDYLLKPISFERFLKAVNKAMRLNLPVNENSPLKATTENENEYIFLRADRKNIKVKLNDLLFIESLNDYIKVVTNDKTIVSKNSISALEELLPASFIRIHRSFIVSLNKIESYSHDLIQIGKFELPVSRSYRHEVEKVLNI